MSEDKFTAIIVGAGPAGSTAAYLPAGEGLDVLLIEKESAPGSKNKFGGRM
jgi:electron transfer flavoprotein-quinone oxidoreductase